MSKSVKTPLWTNSRTNREGVKVVTAANPGPGHYNQQQLSISIKQIKNLLIAESANLCHENNNFQAKLNNVHKDEHRMKAEAHNQLKKEIAEKRGPGLYNILDEQREKTLPREVFQFFGTTSERKDLIVQGEMSKNPVMGPGTYDFKIAQDVVSGHHNRNKTAGFIGHRPENVFGNVPPYPGPSDYNAKQKGAHKFWSSSVQAFGHTEKRFAFSMDFREMEAVPAPG